MISITSIALAKELKQYILKEKDLGPGLTFDMSGIGTIAVTQSTPTNDDRLTFKTYKMQSSDVCNWLRKAFQVNKSRHLATPDEIGSRPYNFRFF